MRPKTAIYHLTLITVAIVALAIIEACNGRLGWRAPAYPWRGLLLHPTSRHQLANAQSARLLSDTPSLLLGLSTLASAVTCCFLFRHLDNVPRALVISKVIAPGMENHSGLVSLKRPLRARELLALWAMMIGLAIIFLLLIRHFQFYPNSWWMNGPKNISRLGCACRYIVPMALWVFIGAEGVFVSFAQMFAFIGATRTFFELRIASQTLNSGFAFQYVEPWESPSQGWTVLWFLMRLKVYGFLTVIMAFFAIYLIFILRESTVPIIGLVILVVFILSSRQLTLLNMVPSLYEDTVGRRLATNSAELAGFTAATPASQVALNDREHAHLINVLALQRNGFSLLLGRIVTFTTMVSTVAGVILPLVLS